MYEVKDKVFFITGAASGIGAGVARAVLDEGAKFVAILDVDVKTGTAFEKELTEKHGSSRVKFIKCDVTTDELAAAYDSVISSVGYIDVVINNAGLMNDSPRVYEKEIAINLTALVTSSLKAFNLMRKDKGGKGGTIINISSILGLTQGPMLPIYSATKSAVLQFSLCLAGEPCYSMSGVRVVTLCFGTTTTALLSREKLHAFDETINEQLFEALNEMPAQSPEAAVRGLVEAYKHGENASVWLVTTERPAENITGNITKAYEIMGKGVYD